jgi:hypothetical protein
MIDQILCCSAGYPARSVRAIFITKSFVYGVSLHAAQRPAGHVNLSAMKLSERRGYNAKKSASFFANY